MLPLFDNVPTRRFPLVNYGLIAANFAVWAWELGSRTDRIEREAFYPCTVSGPCVGVPAHHHPWPEGVLTGMFYTRAGSTSAGTCCSSGSSATTSRT